MATLKYLRADIHIAGFQPKLTLLDALVGLGLQLIESLLPIFRFMPPCLWHPSHPLQFRAVEVGCLFYLRPPCIDAFLPFL